MLKSKYFEVFNAYAVFSPRHDIVDLGADLKILTIPCQMASFLTAEMEGVVGIGVVVRMELFGQHFFCV